MLSYKGAIVTPRVYDLLSSYKDAKTRRAIMKKSKILSSDVLQSIAHTQSGGFLMDELGPDIIFDLMTNKEEIDRRRYPYHKADGKEGEKEYVLYQGWIDKTKIFILEMTCVSLHEKRYIIVRLFDSQATVDNALHQIYNGFPDHYRQGEVLAIPLTNSLDTSSRDTGISQIQFNNNEDYDYKHHWRIQEGTDYCVSIKES